MRRATFAAALAVLGVPAARADDSNFRPYIVGARAAGMGGAFTALADDGSGPYYNPGGLAFARRSSVSLSASVYGAITGTYEDALGDGHGFDYQDLNAFPVSTSVVQKFGSTATPDGSAANTIALSVFVPDALRIDDRDTLGSKQNAFFLVNQAQTVWAGLSYARRLGRLGFGAGVHLLIGSETTQLDLTAAASSDRFANISARTDIQTLGVVGSFGLRLDATEHLRLGLSLFSPEIGSGKRRAFVRVAGNASSVMPMPVIAVVNEDDLAATPTLPLRLQGGVAWSAGGFTVAADAMLLAPREVTDNGDRVGLTRHVVRNTVVNGSLGLEYLIGEVCPIRGGFFTDFAASPAPVPSPPGSPADRNTTNTSHVDRYGGTLSVGFRSEHTATDLGMIVSYGAGKELVPHNLDFTDLVPARATQLYSYVFLASSYEF